MFAFGITQIVYPMNLFAAGRTLPGNTPPDSFLEHQVNTVPALVNEIEHNLTIRRNYARHFGVPPKQIAGYLNKNLSLQTLHQPYRHVVYCVRPDGVFFTVKETMPAGTKVFALKHSGRPVLKWKCGNPFTKRLPQPDSVVTFLRRVHPGPKPAVQTADKVEVITPAETTAVIPVETVLPSTEVISNLPLAPASFVVPAGVVGAGGASLLPFLPLIPVLFAVGGGGGNSTTGGTTSTTGSTSTTGTTSSTATTGTTGTTSTATTGSTGTTATTGTTGSTATTGTTSTATTGTTTSTATTGTTGTTATTGTATTGTTGTTSTVTTGSTGTTATTGTTGTTGSVVPEPGVSLTLGYAFLALGLLAFGSSLRRKRREQE